MVSKLLVVVLSVLLCGCAGGRKQELVVYTSEDRLFSEPILRNFERAYGISVRAVFDKRSSSLVQRLISEKEAPQADVYWADNPMDAELLNGAESRRVICPRTRRRFPRASKTPRGTGRASPPAHA